MTPWEAREPSLSELMQEPIIRAVMHRDAVEETDLRRLLDQARASYGAASLRRVAH